jgi:photosystem II stability/assembly factor-like uncharacterized protein
MKKTILFIAGVTVIALAFLLLNKNNGAPKTSPTPTDSGLTRETNITHGHGLALDIVDSQTLYIATHHGLLVLKNEKELYRLGKSHDDFMGFTVHPNEPDVFFSSGHPERGGNLGFLKSEDAGMSWKKVSDGKNGPVDFHAMTISAADPKIVYGWFQGNLQRSDDAGATWTVVDRDHLFIALTTDPADAQKVYGISPKGEGVLMSSDRGVSWQSLSKELEGGMVSVLAINPHNSAEMLTFAEKQDGLAKSTDSGKTWQKIAERFGGATVLFIAYDKQNPGIAYLLTNENTIWKSIDGGLHWLKIF